jgi:hypothetical protein
MMNALLNDFCEMDCRIGGRGAVLAILNDFCEMDCRVEDFAIGKNAGSLSASRPEGQSER